VILGVFLDDLEGVLSDLMMLRLTKGFAGAVVVLSFLPRQWLMRSDGAKILESPGCFYVQLPLLVEDVFKSEAFQGRVSDQELAEVRKNLGARRIANLAGAIRHDYENRFSLCLAHLREIEKLGHFSEPDFKRLARQIRGTSEPLSRQQIARFRAEVVDLLRTAIEWRVIEPQNDLITLLDNSLAAVNAWSKLNETSDAQVEANLSEVFKRAKDAQTGIRDALAVVTRVKEQATKAISNVG
jgi:hypothetical protein